MSWPLADHVTQRLTHRHVRRSSTCVNVRTDNEWNSQCLEICHGGMLCKHFYKLEAQFSCGCFFSSSFSVFIIIMLSFAVVYFWLSWGGRGVLKSWITGWVEPYVNLGCTPSLLANWLYNFKVKLSCGLWFLERWILTNHVYLWFPTLLACDTPRLYFWSWR